MWTEMQFWGHNSIQMHWIWTFVTKKDFFGKDAAPLKIGGKMSQKYNFGAITSPKSNKLTLNDKKRVLVGSKFYIIYATNGQIQPKLNCTIWLCSANCDISLQPA